MSEYEEFKRIFVDFDIPMDEFNFMCEYLFRPIIDDYAQEIALGMLK